jgi:hypothetical protein
MPSYAHKKIIESILAIDNAPTDPKQFASWIKADQHLRFLEENGHQDETIGYASGPHMFVHSMVVPNEKLFPLDEDDLLAWSCGPISSIASLVSGGGRPGMWVERGPSGIGSKTLEAGRDLIFSRTFEGWSGPDRNYFELNQEYTHLTGIHWRPEERAYCRFDERGDLEHAVSISQREDGRDATLVSFRWEHLQSYLATTDQSLVRMFDFTLVDHENFHGWSNNNEEVKSPSAGLIFRQHIQGDNAAYTRGIQILGCRIDPIKIFERISKGWGGKEDRQYVEFIAHDWRSNRVRKISTDPAATTNYFEAPSNSLPYDVTPAFFRPEVLSKYKTDKDKYAVGERRITCRSAWSLGGYDVNDAGQVHAYICDLRNLPYSEQLHWLGYNEEPKAPISERALVNDFKGEIFNSTNLFKRF